MKKFKKFETKKEIGYVNAGSNSKKENCGNCNNIIEKGCSYDDCALMWKKDRNEVAKGGRCPYHNLTLAQARVH